MADFFGFGKKKPKETPAKPENNSGVAEMGYDTVRLKRKYDEDALAKAVVGEPIEDFDKWVEKNHPHAKTVKPK